jgi:hypothetical protein
MKHPEPQVGSRFDEWVSFEKGSVTDEPVIRACGKKSVLDVRYRLSRRRIMFDLVTM